jgi:hydroxypyruvate isomerase
MKLGLCLEMALTSLPFEARVKTAARLGFKNVEIWWVDSIFKGTPDQLAKLAQANGVTITNTVINAPDGSVGSGLTDPRKSKDAWLERARMTINYTKEAQIPNTIFLTGNRVPDLTDQQMLESVIEWTKPVVDMAEKAGVTLLLEPLNDKYDHPGHWLTSSDLGAEICRRIGSKRLRILFDCYHMQIMEGDLVNHIKRNIDVIGHFHSAGVPGRHEVFIGETNYPFVLSQIEQLGYQGVFGLEFAPSMNDEVSLTQTRAYLCKKA